MKIFSVRKIKYNFSYTRFFTFLKARLYSADIIRLILLFHSTVDDFSGNMRAKLQPLKLILFYFILFYLLTK